MMKRTLTAATVALLGFGVSATMAQPKAPRVVPYKFFDEQYRPGGFDYAYGGKSKGITITKDGGYKSKAALNIKLDPSEYSGASVCLYNETFDLNKFMQNMEKLYSLYKQGKLSLDALADQLIKSKQPLLHILAATQG